MLFQEENEQLLRRDVLTFRKYHQTQVTTLTGGQNGMEWESPSSFSHSQGPSFQQLPESLGRLGRKKPPQAYGESPLEIRLAFLSKEAGVFLQGQSRGVTIGRTHELRSARGSLRRGGRRSCRTSTRTTSKGPNRKSSDTSSKSQK